MLPKSTLIDGWVYTEEHMAICFDISKEKAINPYEQVYDLSVLLGYYQIKAPFISSYQSRIIDENRCHTLINRMVKDRKFVFVNPQARMDIRMKKMQLSDEEIKCVGIRGLLKKKNKDEGELACLLRHIRNAIAHGRVFTLNNVGGTDYILFDDRGKDDSYSARIVVTKKELYRWEDLLERAK